MGRRGRGDGSIRQRKRDGRWEARISLPDGTRKSLYGDTREEVRTALVKALRDLDQGIAPARDGKLTLGMYLRDWLAGLPGQIREQTRVSYEWYVRSYLLQRVDLASTPLAKLTPLQLQRLYADLLREGAKASTVRKLHVILHRVLGDAQRLELVQRNVCDLVKAPKLERSEMHVLSEEQARAFRQAALAQLDRYSGLVALELATGMRSGELRALRWDDVDLDGSASSDGPELRVVSTVYWRDNAYTLTGPKSEAGRRRIPLGPATVAELRAHRARQNQERLAAGVTWLDPAVAGKGGFVFTNEIGEPLRQPAIFRMMRRLCQLSGVAQIRFHDLRHTVATLLLLRGVHPKVVSELLGHANITITLSVYAHVQPHMLRDAVDILDRALDLNAPHTDDGRANHA